MFQFLRLSLHQYVFLCAVSGHHPTWVPPFGNLRVKRLCAPHRSLSQLVTSFVDLLCQGIRHVPLISSYLGSTYPLTKKSKIVKQLCVCIPLNFHSAIVFVIDSCFPELGSIRSMENDRDIVKLMNRIKCDDCRK